MLAVLTLLLLLLFWDVLSLSGDNVIVFAITNDISLDWGDNGGNNCFLLMVLLHIGFCIGDTTQENAMQ